MSARTAPEPDRTTMKRIEAAKAVVAGVLLLSIVFVTPSMVPRLAAPVIPLLAVALLLVPPTDRRAGPVRLGVAAGAITTFAVWVSALIPEQGIEAGEPIQFSGMLILLGFLVLAMVIAAPPVGACAAFLRAWRLLRPPPLPSKSRRAGASRRP